MDDFIQVKEGGRHALVRKAKAKVILPALLEGLGCEAWGVEGRGRLLRFPYGGGHGLIRRYRHGGAARYVLPEFLFLSNRARNEFSVHQYLLSNALPLPGLLGVMWRRRGPFFEGAIATVELECLDLGAWLEQDAGKTESLLEGCGRAIRKMHDLRVWHADLQIRNILIAQGKPWLIDFDRARLLEDISAAKRAANLLRLRRSLVKNGFGEEVFHVICRGYGAMRFPAWLELGYEIKGGLSDLLGGRRRS